MPIADASVYGEKGPDGGYLAESVMTGKENGIANTRAAPIPASIIIQHDITILITKKSFTTANKVEMIP